ncbi:helix-turn-helix transcriptional regulator [Magnetospirillum aberrantis]|uniref:AlpA family phage regulatory protein n=1 Tax=Magnetospirillum aberrantis SpK TaxID=908842 RepID=A0A7C9QVQ2_9PROT|nr:AlpA family phage regulatory protein [Magnetospirillum aberrantis]NFV81299.1 AlpA family phage regulatory protein [Magnetospirillum aberrantis SpK]
MSAKQENSLLDFSDLKARNIIRSRSALHRQIEAGNFPAPIRFPNGRIAWRESAINTWLASLEAAAPSTGSPQNATP